MNIKLIIISIFSLFSIVFGLDNGLARTPQMGWNSWNHFQCNVNETVVMATAKLIVSSGLSKLGYNYVNVDDCWAASRDSKGVIVADPVSFPSGMKALADYVHSLGLKFGLYSDSGTKTCAGRPGSFGYETIDAETYASWGVDYLKYDNCFAQNDVPPMMRYKAMSDALNATGRPILFSMCEWGLYSPWEWASTVGNSWRTTHDIGDQYESFFRVLDNNIGLSRYAGPGAWNDPDMLEVGNGGMNYGEYRAHFALWALLKAPLLIGCDLTTMNVQTVSIITAKEVIAINQDPLGVQGDLVYQSGPMQIWAGPLADGSRAVVVFNRHSPYDPYNTTISLQFNTIGFDLFTSAKVRDLYARKDLGVFQGSISVTLPTHDCAVLKITPTNPKPEHLLWRPWHNEPIYN